MITQNLEKLKTIPIWVNYLLVWDEKKGGYTKPPIDPHTLRNGQTNNPKTWTDYETAAANIGKTTRYKDKNGATTEATIAGCGLITSGGICGIDLDNVINEAGQLAPFAARLLDSLDTYTEFSPSGRGLHLLSYLPDLGEDLGKKFKVNGEGQKDKAGQYEIEIYAYREGGGRYLTVTGNPYPGFDKPINHGKAEDIKRIYKYYTDAQEQNKGKEKGPQLPTSLSVGSLYQSDADIIAKAESNPATGAAFTRLYNGDTSDYNHDHSAADLAFCNMLLYWTNGDADRTERIFRGSGLMRKKWDERHGAQTYGEMTMQKALENFVQWQPGDGFTAEQKKEYGRQLHREFTSSVDTLYQNATQTAQNAPGAPEVEEPVIIPPGADNAAEGQETPLRGLLTFETAKELFINSDSDYLQIPNFPNYSKLKILCHDNIILAADTGSGKTMLALNLIAALCEQYPILYFNLENDNLELLQRLVSLHSPEALTLDQIAGYQNDARTAEKVDEALKVIAGKKPIQIIDDVYYLEDRKINGVLKPGIETEIKAATANRDTKTICFIDTGLLLCTTDKGGTRYERFTHISEELRRIARQNNIILFTLLQLNRQGKEKGKRPDLSALKETGSWENDATQVCFIWKDPKTKQTLLITEKNRHGDHGANKDITLNVDFKRAIMKEAKNQANAKTETGIFSELPADDPDALEEIPFLN